MGCGFPTGNSRYSQKKISRTGNPYFQGAFLSCPVWDSSWPSSIPMRPPSHANWNEVKNFPSINIQLNTLILGILWWPFPIWRYSTRSFRDDHYYQQKDVSTSLMALQRKGWMECESGNWSLPLPKRGVQGYQDRDGILYHWIKAS